MKSFQTMFLHGMLMVDRHRISDAGKAKSQYLTPLVDMYYYETGLSTELGRRVALETGSVSPIVITKALDEVLGNHYRFLGIDYLPQSYLDKVHPSPVLPIYENMTYASEAATPKDHGEFPPMVSHLNYLEGILEEQAIRNFFHSKGKEPRRCIFSECVPGGTSTASLTLSALYGKHIPTPSSSKNPEITRRKEVLVRTALSVVDLSPFKKAYSEGNLDPQFFRYTSDQFQLQLLNLLYWGAVQRLFAKNVEYILAGGSQMLAVVAMLRFVLGRNSAEYRYFLQNVKVVTTSWVHRSILACPQMSEIVKELGVAFIHPDFDFDPETASPALLRYNEGFTGEGCGMGAALYQAKQSGMSNRTITDVVSAHLDRQKAEMSNHA